MNLRLNISTTEDDYFVTTLWPDEEGVPYRAGRQNEFVFVGRSMQEAIDKAVAWATHNNIGQQNEPPQRRHVTPPVPRRDRDDDPFA